MSNISYIFFSQSKSPFSQWHPCVFKVNDQTYFTAEQYMMHQKAILFGDQEAARLIMSTKDPRKHKSLGRKVKGFNEDVWDANRIRIVYEGNYAKFTQNPRLLKALMETVNKTLVEASPWDSVWGIGLDADDPRSLDPATWKGENLLGFTLTKLCNDLLTKKS